MMHTKNLLKTVILGFVTSLTACGGGGGSGPGLPLASGLGSAPTTSVNQPPSPLPTATLVPVSLSTMTPILLTVSGKAKNFDTNTPLLGAVVYISHTLISGATAPMNAPVDGAETTTGADGSYTMILPQASAYPSQFYVEVFMPGMATIHDVLVVSHAGVNTFPDLKLTTLSVDEAAWLDLLNQDRAKWNAPPLVFDETVEEVARLWAAFLATGYFEHACASTDVACPNKINYYQGASSAALSSGENIAAGQPGFARAESDFMSETQYCPQPTNPATCAFTENTGHFLNIVRPDYVWFGNAEVFNGIGLTSTTGIKSGSTNYYVQEFSFSGHFGPTIYDRFRSLSSY